MEHTERLNIPVYQQIAVDIASKIVDGHYSVGERIYARSSIATQYSVSPETARRAISVLHDMAIVDITKGSGVIITSLDNAVKMVKQYQDVTTISELKADIAACIETIEDENRALKNKVTELLDKTDRFHSTNPFTPFQMEITTACPMLKKTISELNFWHNTAATIIGIKRGTSILLSPGPYSALENGDVIYFVGNEECFVRVKAFLYPGK